MNLELKEVATDSVHAVGEVASALAEEVHNMMPGDRRSRRWMSKRTMIMMMIAAAATTGLFWWKQRRSDAHGGHDHASRDDHHGHAHDHQPNSDQRSDDHAASRTDSTGSDNERRHLRSA